MGGKGENLSTRNFDFVPQFLQQLRHTLAMFPLDFDHPILNCTASAAFLFESFGEGFQVVFSEDKVLQDGNHLTPTST